jgi:hypothetical protein
MLVSMNRCHSRPCLTPHAKNACSGYRLSGACAFPHAWGPDGLDDRAWRSRGFGRHLLEFEKYQSWISIRGVTMTGLKVSEMARPRRARASTTLAKVFWMGRSQAVRLPKEFHFAGDEVHLSRRGSQVILEHTIIELGAHSWPLSWWKLAGAASEFEVGERMSDHERGDVRSGAHGRHPR